MLIHSIQQDDDWNVAVGGRLSHIHETIMMPHTPIRRSRINESVAFAAAR